MKYAYMKKMILILLLSGNSSAFAGIKCINYLASLDIQSDKSEYTSQTVVPYPKINVSEIFSIFFRAVDLGQLRLFDKTLTRDMLRPVKVEYIYTQADPYPTVNVFSELRNPIPLPAMPDAYIMGVSGVMDMNGNIVESIAHCNI
jgi:hypothetical protein